jgi:integrase/recombinase XerD
MLGLAPNTVEAYGRGLEDFLRWCESAGVEGADAGRADLAGYVRDLRRRPGPRGKGVVALSKASKALGVKLIKVA